MQWTPPIALRGMTPVMEENRNPASHCTGAAMNILLSFGLP